jgi:uncharacterized protein YndB with AHSA1/START domain
MSTRQHEFTIDIAASPEEVWRAITDGEAIQKWFAPDVKVTPGPGGSIALSWGPGCEGTAPIHLWEEGKRAGWTEGAKRVEFEIEAIGGGSTRLRLVHSGFGSDAKFDDEYDSTHGGWLTFLAMLAYSVEKYAQVPALHVHVLTTIPTPAGEQWKKLIGPAGIAIDSLADGQPYHARLGGLPISGTVIRHAKPGYLFLTAPDSLVALFVEKSGGSSMQTIQWILFGDARKREAEVRRALAELTNAPAMRQT